MQTKKEKIIIIVCLAITVVVLGLVIFAAVRSNRETPEIPTDTTIEDVSGTDGQTPEDVRCYSLPLHGTANRRTACIGVVRYRLLQRRAYREQNLPRCKNREWVLPSDRQSENTDLTPCNTDSTTDIAASSRAKEKVPIHICGVRGQSTVGSLVSI